MSIQHYDGKPITGLSTAAITAIWAARAFYVHQADVVLNQASPVSGTQYEVLGAQTFVRIYTISTRVTWTVAPDPLQIHVTALDGNNQRHDQATPASAQWYNAVRIGSRNEASQEFITTDIVDRAFLYEGKSLTNVNAEVTGGTVDPLEARVKWARYV